ncbi:nitrate- and nitrite sensing domain-containing protein [Nonomuraea thailandensis]
MLLLPLLSLSALWGFVLNLTMGDAQSLLRANTLYDTIGVTSTDLGLQLQAERVRSAEALTTRELTEVLGGQRARTDKSVADFRQAAADAGGAVGDDLRRPLDNLNMALDRLALIRSDIDNGISSRLAGLTEYNRVLDALFRLYDHLITVSDLEIFQQASSLQAMGMAREYIAREHALAIGALADARLTPQETAAFTEYAASRKFLHSRGLAGLDVTLRRPYEQVFATEPFLTFATMESRVIKTGAPPRRRLLAPGRGQAHRPPRRPRQDLLRRPGRPYVAGRHRHRRRDRHRGRRRLDRRARVDHHLCTLRSPPGRGAGRAARGRGRAVGPAAARHRGAAAQR